MLDLVLIAMLAYPIAVTVGSLWATQKLLRHGRVSGKKYALASLGLLLLPPLLLIIALSLSSLLGYHGVCSGWMDSPDWQCSPWEYLELQAFWSAMLGFVPGLTGMGITLAITVWAWVQRHNCPD